MTRDPYLRDRELYDAADALGWPARAAIGGAALLVGAGVGLILVAGGAWRRLIG